MRTRGAQEESEGEVQSAFGGLEDHVLHETLVVILFVLNKTFGETK